MEKAEGIVLRITPYAESSRILTVFTKEHGIISLFIKRLSQKNSALLGLTSPLSRGEYLFSKGNSSLYRFYDGTLLDEHLFLRTEWQHLATAGEMAQLLVKSQLPGKPAPLLYSLLLSYLAHIPMFSHPATLIGSFTLKLLQHEGVLPEMEVTELVHLRSFKELQGIVLSPTQERQIQELAKNAHLFNDS